MRLRTKSLNKILGLLLVFGLPALLAGTAITRDIIFPAGSAIADALRSDAPVQQADRSYDSNVFREPVVSIVFDDGWSSVYENAYPILEEHGICSTQFIISGVTGNPAYMSAVQIEDMLHNCHEIQSHTVTHRNLTELSNGELKDELFNSRVSLEHLTNQPVEDIAVPLGAYNEAVQKAAKTWYRSLRTTSSGINTLENFDAYKLYSPTIDASHTVEDIQKMIAEAKERNGWLILTYHQIDNSNLKYAVTPENFRAQIDTVIASSVDIVPFGEVLNLIKDQNK